MREPGQRRTSAGRSTMRRPSDGRKAGPTVAIGAVLAAALILCAQAASGFARAHARVGKPVTLLTAKGGIGAFAQDGPWLVWAQGGACQSQVRIRRVGGGPTRSLLSRRGANCKGRFEGSYTGSMALAGSRALWSLGSGSTATHFFSVRTSSLADRFDRMLIEPTISADTSADEPPWLGVPLAGDGPTLLYVDSNQHADGGSGVGGNQVFRVTGDGRAEGIPRTWGSISVAASGSIFAAGRLLRAGERRDAAPAWAPGGRRLLFQATRDAGESSPFGVHDILIVDRDGAHERPITAGVEHATAAWSPDGARLLLTDDIGGRVGIVVLDPDSGARTVVSRGRIQLDGPVPAWSPDGRRVAFQLETGLYVAGADGSAQRRVTPKQVRWFSWSPDGARIAFRAGDALQVVGVDGAGVRTIVAENQELSWSPDGSRIAWSQSTAPAGMYVGAADGSSARRLVTGEHAYPLDWSPDGRDFSTSSSSRATSLMVARVNGAGVRKLYDPGDRAVWGSAWAPDSSRVAIDLGYADDGSTVSVLIVARDGASIRLLDDAEDASWSPDGSTLAYGSSTDPGGLYTASADGADPHRLTHPAAEPAWRGVELRNAHDGTLRTRIPVNGFPTAIALTAARVAIMVAPGVSRIGKTRRIEVHGLDGTLQRSLDLPRGVDDHLAAAGNRVVFRTGRTIRAIDLRTGRRTVLVVARSAPVGLLIEGRRVAWGEEAGRIRALTLPAG